MSKKEAYRQINKELKRNEEKNGGPNNRNINFHLKIIITELGKVAENITKATIHQGNQEKYETYFVGFKNNLAKLGARVVAALDYLERNFEANGRSKDIEGENKK